MSSGAATLTTHEDVYILDPLSEPTDHVTHTTMERKRKEKDSMKLSVWSGVPPIELVPVTVFQEEQNIVDDKPELIIPTQLPETLYTAESSGEKQKQQVLIW